MLKAIVCVAEDWGIGKSGGLLFDIPADMRYFRDTTKHNVVVMGYTTYLSIGKPLPHRVNVILWDKATSSDCIPGCIAFNDFEALLNFTQVLSKEYDVYICGGQSVYRLFLPYYDEILVTHVDALDPEATAFFPNLDEEKLYYIDRTLGGGNDNGLNYEFRVYKKL